jgi:hypothetical protein
MYYVFLFPIMLDYVLLHYIVNYLYSFILQ